MRFTLSTLSIATTGAGVVVGALHIGRHGELVTCHSIPRRWFLMNFVGPRQPENRGYELLPRYQNSSIATTASSLTLDSVTDTLSYGIASVTSADDVYNSLSTPKSSSIEESTPTESGFVIRSTAGTGIYGSHPTASSSPLTSTVNIPEGLESGLNETSNAHSLNKTNSGFQHSEQIPIFVTTKPTGYNHSLGFLPNISSTEEASCFTTPGTVTYTVIGFATTIRTTVTITTQPYILFQNSSKQADWQPQPTPPPVAHDNTKHATTVSETAEETPEPSQNRIASLLERLFPRVVSTSPTTATPKPVKHIQKRRIVEVTRVWTGIGPPPLDEYNTYDPKIPSSAWPTAPPVTLSLNSTTGIFQLPADPPTHIESLPVETGGCVVQDVATTTLKGNETWYETVTNTRTYGATRTPLPTLTQPGDPDSGCLICGIDHVVPPPNALHPPAEPPIGSSTPPVDIEDHGTTRIYWETPEVVPAPQNPNPRDIRILVETGLVGIAVETGLVDNASKPPPPEPSPQPNTGDSEPGNTFTGSSNNPAPDGDVTEPGGINTSDTDQDGTPDGLDPDTDNDGTPDLNDDDIDGDNISNEDDVDWNTSDSTDSNGNGIPDSKPDAVLAPKPADPNSNSNDGNSVEVDFTSHDIITTSGTAPSDDSGNPSKPVQDSAPPAPNAPENSNQAPGNSNQGGSPGSNTSQGGLGSAKDTDNDGVEDHKDGDVDGDNIINENDPDWVYVPPPKQPEPGLGVNTPGNTPNGENVQHGNPKDNNPDADGTVLSGTSTPESPAPGKPNQAHDTIQGNNGQNVNAPSGGDAPGAKPNQIPGNPNSGSSLKPTANMDTDGDHVDDSLDADVDGDNIPNELDSDYVPPPSGNINLPADPSSTTLDSKMPGSSTDSDADGLIDSNDLDADSNGDGVQNQYDPSWKPQIPSTIKPTSGSQNQGPLNNPSSGNTDTDGSGAADIKPPDVDGDGTSNEENPDWSPSDSIDSDLDGTADSNDPGADVNADGVVNALDPNWKPKVPAASPGSPSATSTGSMPNFTPGASYFNPTGPTDQDFDGISDLEDPDIDGDGIRNGVDTSFHPADQLDANKNGIADSKDPDADMDGNGIANHLDPHYNPLLHVDSNSDGTPDGTDPTADADGDGLVNSADADWHPDMLHTEVDTDGDGVVNHNDDDLDGDGIANADDDDVDGDGKLNKVDTDTDSDGIKNQFDTDLDGDRVANAEDDDIDNDGVKNADDLDINGDGVRNSADVDVDGDGLANGKDLDVDGDGVKNGDDDDVDGDGVKNADDLDADGDGIENAVDTDVDGDGVRNGKDDDVDGDGVKNDDDVDVDADRVTNEDDKDVEGDGFEDEPDRADNNLVEVPETETDVVEEEKPKEEEEEEDEEDAAAGSFGGISFIAAIASIGSGLLILF